SDAYLVEQISLRERQVLFPAFFDRKAHEIVDEHRVGVPVAADRVRRPLGRTRGRVLERVDASGIEEQMIRVRVRIEFWLAGRLDSDPARHPQQILNADLLTRVARPLPL